jgi:cation diffusion facilitator family transporter
MSDKENAVVTMNEYEQESFDLDALEQKLEEELGERLSGLEQLKEEHKLIGNPDGIGTVVLNSVWEQFINQVGVVAGEDFIEANRGLKLDLRDEAHIQTTENFVHGKIASHNSYIDYQTRYDEMRQDFQTAPTTKTNEYTRYNEDTKVEEKYDSRSGEWKAKLADGAREKFDTRTADQKGSKTIHKDHVIPVAEQIRDMDAAAHLDRKERTDFAKSDVNIQDLDAAANQSKGDLTTEQFLDTERDGKKPDERFNIDKEKMLENDKKAREEYEKMKEKGKQKSIETGKKSQREEAFRIGGKAVRAAVTALLAELVRNIIAKLIQWIRSGEKNFSSFFVHLKEALYQFLGNMKKHVLTVGDSVLTTIATAIFGPIVGMVKKVWMLLKQGARSIKQAIDYLRNPENKGKSTSILLLEVSKIVTAGLAAAGAVILGQTIETSLLTIPVLAIEIPLFGSIASILGMFSGALVSGIVGALVVNMIDKLVAKKRSADSRELQISKRNEIIIVQGKMRDISAEQLARKKEQVTSSISERHAEMSKAMRASLENIYADDTKPDHQDTKSEIERLLGGMSTGKA